MARGQIRRDLQGRVDDSDVAQETFLAAHRDFARFRVTTEAELVSWLRHILAARLADLVRHHVGARRRDVRLEQRLADELDRSSRALGASLVDRQPSPSQQAARREQAVLLADALKALPPDYAEVIVLRHIEGLSFPEVAQRMGRSAGSVEKLWVRALVRLMSHWLADADFAGVRGPEALAKLPEAERQPWQELWAEVEQLRTRARGEVPGQKK